MKRCLFSLALGIALLSTRISALRPQNPDPGDSEVINEIEGQLRLRGVQTDTNSLMSEARSNSDLGIRSDAVQLLGYRKEIGAKETLLGVLHSDPEPGVRENAAWSLARIGAPEGIVGLKDMLTNTEDVKQRCFIAGEIARFGDPGAYRYVVEAIASKNAEIRFLCVSHLFPFLKFEGKRDAELIDPLEQLNSLLRDRDGRVRKEALSVIGRAVPTFMSREKIQPVIRKMSEQDSDLQVRATAASILRAWDFEDSNAKH